MMSVHGESGARGDAYSARVFAETAIFAGQTVVHDLPPIFHYWSNTWLRPQLEAFGFSSPDEFFATWLGRSHDEARAAGRDARFVSIGSGNGDTEAGIARRLLDSGRRGFSIECLDLNAAMLQRGEAHARQEGLAEHVTFVQGDFNAWQPRGRYDAVMANQSLHHVVNLEGLFDAIASALAPGGRFLTSDMIGRNGHQRWPEALERVREFWMELPRRYRRGVQLGRYEPTFLDWDCSVAGFEGIRAQDVLPLLMERFAFEFFFAYGNLVDPFIDRNFGPNFDATLAWDRDFIDRVHRRDEQEMLAGRIKPTHLIAVMRDTSFRGPTIHREGLTPESAVRRP